MAFPNTISTTVSLARGFPGAVRAPNGAFYVIQILADFPNSFIQVYKSIDNGVTWVLQDNAHSPLTIGLGLAITLGGTIIYAVNVDTSGAFTQISTYDTATDLWVATTITSNAAIFGFTTNVFFRIGDSKLVICGDVASFFSAGEFRAAYFTFDTGALTWSAWAACGETMASGLDWECFAIVAGTAEVDFLFWSKATGGGSGGTRAIWRQPLSNVDVLGSITSIDNVTDAGLSSVVPMAFSDGITASIIWSQTDQAPLAATVYKAPVSTWSFATQTLTVTGDRIFNTAIANSTSAGVLAFLTAYALDMTTADFWFSQDTGGGLGALTMIGSIASFVVQDPGLWANLFGVLGFGIVIAESGGEGPSTYFFWLQPVAPPAQLTLACPINNTAALTAVYSGQMIAGGATGPFTYTLVGGGLPPGLALDTSTGIISGTPAAAGFFSYSVKVTDGAGDTPATVTCQIAVLNCPNVL